MIKLLAFKTPFLNYRTICDIFYRFYNDKEYFLDIEIINGKKMLVEIYQFTQEDLINRSK